MWASNGVGTLILLFVVFFVVIPFTIQVARAVRANKRAALIAQAKAVHQTVASVPGYKRYAGDPAWRYCAYCRHSTDTGSAACPTCGAHLPPRHGVKVAHA